MTRVGPSAAWGEQIWLRYSVQVDHLFCYGRSGGTGFEGGPSTADSYIRESVDFLCRDSADAQYMQYAKAV